MVQLRIQLKKILLCKQQFPVLTLIKHIMEDAPAAGRNKEHILQVLLKYIPENFDGKFLEFASGTGQHITHFAQTYTKVVFQPSDIEQDHVESVAAYTSHLQLQNVLPPLYIDVTDPVSTWPGNFTPSSYDVIYNANMIHISPFNTAIGLFESAAVLLKPGCLMFTYGPYAENGVLQPISNVNFDKTLKSRDKEWGIRDINDLKVLAEKNGITLLKKVDMPANNKTLIWKKL